MSVVTDETVVFCAYCGEPVPLDRVIRGAVTCKSEHAKLRRSALDKLLRAQKEEHECLYCHKPSTPEKRAAYLRFQRLERKVPHLLYPKEFETWAAEQTQGEAGEGGTPEEFAKWRNAIIPKALTNWAKKKEAPVDEDDDERPTGPPAVKLPPMQEPNSHQGIYIFQMDEFGKKGEPCEMLKTRSRRTDIVQVRFADGYMPVVARSALRPRRPSDPEYLLDTGGEVSRTLAASGTSHTGE